MKRILVAIVLRLLPFSLGLTAYVIDAVVGEGWPLGYTVGHCLGPIILILRNASIASCVFCIPCCLMAICPNMVKPNVARAILSFVGGFLWGLVGYVAATTSC